MNEQFSAFLDNEASRDEADSVVNALLRDRALRASWSRQHWLRTTLRAHRGEAVLALDTDFSARVMRAIAGEQAPAAPAPAAPRRQSAGRRQRRWAGMAGVAVVASAAGVVLFVGGPLAPERAAPTTGAPARSATLAQSDPQRAQPRAAAATTASAGGERAAQGTGSARARQTVAVAQRPANHWSVSDPALETELNGYLAEHNGLARDYGMAGTTPAFVRVATYGQATPR